METAFLTACLCFGFAFLVLSLWLGVLAARFLESGRRAFDHYLDRTGVSEPPIPHAPTAPSYPRTTEPPRPTR